MYPAPSLQRNRMKPTELQVWVFLLSLKNRAWLHLWAWLCDVSNLQQGYGALSSAVAVITSRVRTLEYTDRSHSFTWKPKVIPTSSVFQSHCHLICTTSQSWIIKAVCRVGRIVDLITKRLSECLEAMSPLFSSLIKVYSAPHQIIERFWQLSYIVQEVQLNCPGPGRSSFGPV